MILTLKSFWRHSVLIAIILVNGEFSKAVESISVSRVMAEIPLNPLTETLLSNSIKISWDDTMDDMGYIIQMSSEMATGFFTIGEVEIDVASFTATDLANHSTEYFFRVAAIGSPNSDWSEVVSAITDAPEPPSNLLSGTITAISIELNWDDNTTFEDGYRVERSDNSGMTFSFVGDVVANMTTFIDMGLSGLTTYQYQVAAKLGPLAPEDLTVFSNILEVTTIAPVIPNGAPSGLSATVLSSTEIRINWSDQSTNENGFIVERSDFIDGVYTEVGEVGMNVTTFTSTKLQPSSKYFFRVKAFNDEGETNVSSSVNATTDVALPIAPSGLTVVSTSNNEISIEWVDEASFENGYRVQIEEGELFNTVAELEIDTESYVLMGLLEATAYSIRVVVFNSGGETPSNKIVGVTTQDPPEAPSQLTLSINSSGDEIEMSWLDNSNNEEGFAVERSVGDLENFEEIVATDSDEISFKDTVEVGLKYFYRVRAFNDGGNSDYSNITGNVLASVNLKDIDSYISVYPNPNIGLLNISSSDESSKLKSIRIYDYTGRLFRSYELEDRYNQYSIDLSAQPDGLYFVEVDIANTTLIKKVILSK